MTKSYTGKFVFQEKVTATLMEIPQGKFVIVYVISYILCEEQ